MSTIVDRGELVDTTPQPCDHHDALLEKPSWRDDIGEHHFCLECQTYIELDGSEL